MRVALLVLALSGCKLDALLAPQPRYEWGCIRYESFSVSFRDGDGNEHGAYTQWCVEEGLVRK